jgi:hypothetical protein
MYSPQQLKVAKIAVLATWIFGASAFFFPVYDWSIGPLGRALFGILFAVHLVEFAIFGKFYRSTGEPIMGHFFKHMVYGVIYQTEVKQRIEQA